MRVLVADDDVLLRRLYVSRMHEIPGVTAVVEAGDGAEAERLAARLQIDVAVLDLNMPHLDGVEAALRMRRLQPTLRIALQSSDATALRDRARGLELPLFDKLDLELLTDWVEEQAAGSLRV
jgi:DNA-binding NarL/FixJ family response regulator